MKKAIVIFVAALLGIFVVIVIGEVLQRYGYPGWGTISYILGLGLIIFFATKASKKS
jgi:hypothetical protein